MKGSCRGNESGASGAAWALGALMVAAAALVTLSLALPHPAGTDTVALIAIVATALGGGALCFVFARRMPLWAVHAGLCCVVALTGFLIYASGSAAGQYGVIFALAIFVAAYFFGRRVAVAHIAWTLLVYGGALVEVGSAGGYSVFTRWLIVASTLIVVSGLTSEMVARRARADSRARSFFDLSHDLLSTSDAEGYFVELNAAWERCLGYSCEELRARPFIELVHPDDRARTEAEHAVVFAGAGTMGFENRYRAKDGSWRWLRWSSTLAPEESVIYARATDVSELKRIGAEREDLLAEVSLLTADDALTGLPNRRILDERLAHEMARARRAESSLCLAIVDIDFFKAYNDAHGHPAGDMMLRDCAVAWDSVLRGEDTLVRYGGEEFLVLLPECEIERAATIVERLRAATPDGQTCSAGLARWDFAESGEDLVERAGGALFMAKSSGRDKLVF